MTASALRAVLSTLMLLICAGCGGQDGYDRDFDRTLESVNPRPAANVPPTDASGTDEVRLVSESGDAVPVRRRIVYDAELSLVVAAYGDFEAGIDKLVEQYEGFISRSETNRRYEDRQSGTWVARIPVANYSRFLSSVVQLGFPESRVEEANDITAEYVDVESRIKNNQKLETRILELLDVREGKLADVLEIERELARVRDEIERMQGRLRVLADQSSLATITMQVREERQYVPPTAPTFSSRITSTWSHSLSGLQRSGETLLILAVATLPWLFVLGIVGILIFFVARTATRMVRR